MNRFYIINAHLLLKIYYVLNTQAVKFLLYIKCYIYALRGLELQIMNLAFVFCNPVCFLEIYIQNIHYGEAVPLLIKICKLQECYLSFTLRTLLMQISAL